MNKKIKTIFKTINYKHDYKEHIIFHYIHNYTKYQTWKKNYLFFKLLLYLSQVIKEKNMLSSNFFLFHFNKNCLYFQTPMFFNTYNLYI